MTGAGTRPAGRLLLLGALLACAACQSPLRAEPFRIPEAAEPSFTAAKAQWQEAKKKDKADPARIGLLAVALAQARQAQALAPDTFRIALLVQDLEFELEGNAGRSRYSADPPNRAPDLTLAARALLPERSADAKELLNRALEVDPEFAWAHYGLAFVEWLQGHSEVAQGQAELALQLDPSLREALRLLCELYEKGGVRDRAIEARRLLVATSDQPLFERHDFAKMLLESDDRDDTKEALKLLDALITELRAREAQGELLSAELVTLERDVLLDRGTALALRGNAAGAIEAWEAVLLLDPDCLTALSNLGVIHRGAGEDAAALDAFERYLARAEAIRDPLPIDQVRYRYFYVPDAVLDLRRRLGLPTEPPPAPPVDPDTVPHPPAATAAPKGIG